VLKLFTEIHNEEENKLIEDEIASFLAMTRK